MHLPRIAVENRDGCAGIIDEQLFARMVFLAQCAVLGAAPLAVQIIARHSRNQTTKAFPVS
jgi:hypothetical protein